MWTSTTTSSFATDDVSHVGNRDRWGSRTAFLLAAIGSAVGIGNLWRFPYLAFRFGGGAFFIPYFLALFLVGIPILQLEFALGQYFQGGHVVAFDGLHKRARGLGLAAPFSCFMVVVYYSVILSWSLVYFAASFISPLPWATSNLAMTETCASFVTEESCGSLDVCIWRDMNCKPQAVVQADNFFAQVLNLNDPSAFTLHGCGIAVAGLAVTWICIFFAIFKGARFLGKVLYVTMVLPTILLLVMTIRSITLEGSSDGLQQYILRWDFSILVTDPEIWSAAVGQIFFSLGVCYGVMTAYASFNQQNHNVVRDAIVVALSNSAFSLVAGIVVFAVAGHLAYISNGSLDELKTSGVGLVFMTFPTALSEMSGIAAHIFSALFFIMFFLLGIDSAFSMVEAFVTLLSDSKIFSEVNKVWITLPICIIGFLFSLPFASNVGPDLVEAVDFAIANFASLFIGLTECAVAGWLQGATEQADVVGGAPVVFFALSYFGSVILASFLGFGVKTPLGSIPRAGAVLGPVFGVLFFGVGTLLSVLLLTRKSGLFYHKPTLCHSEIDEANDGAVNNNIENGGNNNIENGHNNKNNIENNNDDICHIQDSDSKNDSNNNTISNIDNTNVHPHNTNVASPQSLLFTSLGTTTTTSSDDSWPRSFKSQLWWLFLGNVECLRRDLNRVVAVDRTACCCTCPSMFSQLTIIWSIAMKFVIPGFLLAILVKTFFSDELPQFRAFPVAYQTLGLTLSAIAISIVLLGLALPATFKHLLPGGGVDGKGEAGLETADTANMSFVEI
eukprot:CAMPEP_0113844168 /NCGR_PEP_ID=MMETSP0372-20130328/102_1 /TAXON_ID=340204 /ORGANISM="Lankesteria abbotti" /LENGTH=785 /DNA_ID=CAMNT_0000813171 /DNA_START=107 /DNA_END=2464 /DNA_ORIENTATION=- /assembly_acc=CAM_ASM_000359